MTPLQVRSSSGEAYRRRRFDGTHRRRSPLRNLVRPLATAALLVALPAAGATWALTSPLFELQSVRAQGSARVSEQWIHNALDPLAGRSLFRLALSEVERRITTHPWVGGVAIRKKLPNSLEVSVEERRPVAVLRHADGLFFVDRQGERIAPFNPGEDIGDLLVVSVREGVVANFDHLLRVTNAVAELAPDWAATLGEVEILNEQDMRLHLGALPYPVLVTAAGIDLAIPALRRYLPIIHRRYPVLDAVDLRFDHQLVLQPAEVPQYQGG